MGCGVLQPAVSPLQGAVQLPITPAGGDTALVVDLVGEFVDDHVVGTLVVTPRHEHIPPRQHQGAVGHILAGTAILPFHHDAAFIRILPRGQIFVRIDHDGRHGRKTAPLPVQQQQAGLAGNGHAYLVVHLQAVAPLETFLRQEDLDMAAQLLPVFHGQARVERNVMLQNHLPRVGKGAHLDAVCAAAEEG